MKAGFAEAEAALSADLARAHDAGTPLEVMGGGSRRGVGRPVQAAETVGAAAFNGVTLYEPGALTLVVGAGTPVAEVEALLARDNQRLGFEPPDFRALTGAGASPTVGGMVATNLSGPRRIQAGACRDAMLGVRFVDGRGTAVANGGRVMKNVTGYDLVKLMTGSWGSLGVITEVALKVLPAAETAATVAVEGLAPREAVAAMARALGSPFDVTGAAHDPAAGRTFVRVEGFADSVAYRAERLATLIGGRVAGDDPWPAIRDVTCFADRPVVWRASVKPTDAPALLEAAPGLDWLMDWGGGLVWLAADDANAEAVAAAHAALRAAVAATGGHVTLFKAPGPVRAGLSCFQPDPPPLAALTGRLKAAFDPKGVLNPGRMD